MTDRNIRVQKVFVSRVWRFRNTYLSWGFLQVEAEDVGRDVADLHGLSFTLPSGLFTPLQGKMKRVLWGRGSLDKVLLLEKRSWQYIQLHILKHKHVHKTDPELKRSRPNTSGTKIKEFRRMFFIFFYIDLDKITGFTGRFWIFSTGRKDLEILEITDLLVKFEWLLILCVLCSYTSCSDGEQASNLLGDMKAACLYISIRDRLNDFCWKLLLVSENRSGGSDDKTTRRLFNLTLLWKPSGWMWIVQNPQSLVRKQSSCSAGIDEIQIFMMED